jgi:DME family drug/metabolite transporter
MGGQWYVLAAAVLWGTTGTAQALAPDSAQPASVGAARLAVAGLALLALAAGRGSFKGQSRSPARPVLLAGACMAAYQLLFFAGVARAGVAVGTVVAIGSAPILAGLLAWLMDHARPDRRWIAATLLAIVGCTLLVTAGERLEGDRVGIVLALGAGGSYALYALASKRLLTGRSPDAVTAAVFAVGGVLLLPVLVTSDLDWLREPRGLAAALHLGLVATAAAYILFVRGLMTVPTATAVTLSLAEPLTAATLGLVVVGERLSGPALGGMGLLLAGLLLLALNPDRRVSGWRFRRSR